MREHTSGCSPTQHDAFCHTHAHTHSHTHEDINTKVTKFTDNKVYCNLSPLFDFFCVYKRKTTAFIPNHTGMDVEINIPVVA